MQTEQRTGVLSGIRVLDFTTFLSGPFATQTLGDMGAEVIKVEAINGDVTRDIPPYFVGNDSMYYLSSNRNKKSISLNLKHQAGKDVIYQLARNCDIVIENFRPGVTERIGIDYQTIKSHRSNIIYCSITGFGQDGPSANQPAYDMIVQALSGTMSITGEKNGDPVRLGTPLGDIGAGLYAVIGVLGALHERNETGEGQYLDISMLDCQLPLLSYLGAYYLNAGYMPGPQGREHDSIPTYRALKAGDGRYVLITANTQKMFEGVCKAIDREDLIENPKFRTGELRLKYKQELVELLKESFLTMDSFALLERLKQWDVPCAPLQNVRQAFEDPQVKHRKMVVELTHQTGAKLKMIGNPLKYDRYTGDTHISPPLLGEHSITLLKEHGYDQIEIEQLLSSGTVRGSKPL